MILRLPSLPTALRMAAFAVVLVALLVVPLLAAASSPPRLAVRWGDDGIARATASPVQVALLVAGVWCLAGARCRARAIRGDRIVASLTGAAVAGALLVVEGVTVLVNVGAPDAGMVPFGSGDVAFMVLGAACAAGIGAGLALLFERWATGSEHLTNEDTVPASPVRARLRPPVRG